MNSEVRLSLDWKRVCERECVNSSVCVNWIVASDGCCVLLLSVCFLAFHSLLWLWHSLVTISGWIFPQETLICPLRRLRCERFACLVSCLFEFCHSKGQNAANERSANGVRRSVGVSMSCSHTFTIGNHRGLTCTEEISVVSLRFQFSGLLCSCICCHVRNEFNERPSVRRGLSADECQGWVNCPGLKLKPSCGAGELGCDQLLPRVVL